MDSTFIFWFIVGFMAGAVMVILWGLTRIEDSESRLIEALRDKDRTIDSMEEELETARGDLDYLNQTIADLRENPAGEKKPLTDEGIS